MSDERIRLLERSGDFERWHAALLRAGKLTLYNKPIGPLSVLEAECAHKACNNKLKWSNCSFCEVCHTNECPDWNDGEEVGLDMGDEWFESIGVNVIGELDQGDDYSCNKLAAALKEVGFYDV